MNSAKIFVTALIVAWLSMSHSAWAASFKIIPFAGLNPEYSDNILFSYDQTESDYVTTLFGGLTIEKKTETLDAGIEAQLDKLIYQEFDELNSLDNQFSGYARYRVSQRLGIGARARYLEDSRRDRETDTTGLVVSGERKSSLMSVSSDYLFTESVKGDITLAYGAVETDDINSTENNDQIQVDISFSKNLSRLFKNTTGILNFSYLHYTSDVDSSVPVILMASDGSIYSASGTKDEYRSDIFQLSTGFSKDITRLYNIYFLVGASHARTEEEIRSVPGGILTAEESDEIWGGVLSAGVNYEGLYYDMGLAVSRDMRGASGTNGAVQRSSVSGNIGRKITDHLTLRFNASCYLNQNERETQGDIETVTVNLQPELRYNLPRNFTLSTGYNFSSVEDRESNTTKERNLIYLVLEKKFKL